MECDISLELWYNPPVDAHNCPEQQRSLGNTVSGRLVGLQGRLAGPFWGLMGAWAVLCGALATNRLHWDGDSLLALALVVTLADLAWGTLWDLATGVDWYRPLADGWALCSGENEPASGTGMPVALPYTQPGSPGGRLAHWLGRIVGWWRETVRPVCGPELLGILAAVLLAVVLSVLLPPRLYPLNLLLVLLLGLGGFLRRMGKEPLAGQAVVLVGLSWLAGHMAFDTMTTFSWVLAAGYVCAAWGALALARGGRRRPWLMLAGQGVCLVLLAWAKQPLAVGALGLAFFAQLALLLSLRFGGESGRVARGTWPWLMFSMLVAAVAVP